MRVTGSVRAAVTYDGNIVHSFTFAGGIVSHEGGHVDGNTITINTGDYKLVGNPGSGKASQTPSAAPTKIRLQALITRKTKLLTYQVRFIGKHPDLRADRRNSCQP